MTCRLMQVGLALLILAFAALPATADVIRQQPACNFNCVSIPGSVTDGVYDARAFTFNAPGKGIAIVSFNGTLYCVSNRTSLADVATQSQIVENNAIPSAAGPSGLYYGVSFEPNVGGSRANTFNLASSRIFSIAAAGQRTFQFRLKATTSSDVSCGVRHGAFRVHFVD